MLPDTSDVLHDISFQTHRHPSSLPAWHWKSTEQDLQHVPKLETDTLVKVLFLISQFFSMSQSFTELSTSQAASKTFVPVSEWTGERMCIYLPDPCSHEVRAYLLSRWPRPCKRVGESSCSFPNPSSPCYWQSLLMRLSNIVVECEQLGWVGREDGYAVFPSGKKAKSQQSSTGTKLVTLSVMPHKSDFGKVSWYAYGMKNSILEKHKK